MIYRAHYLTKSGTVRRMTFEHSGGIKAAHTFAEQWAIGDKLEAVATVLARRPEFKLQANLIGV